MSLWYEVGMFCIALLSLIVIFWASWGRHLKVCQPFVRRTEVPPNTGPPFVVVIRECSGWASKPTSVWKIWSFVLVGGRGVPPLFSSFFQIAFVCVCVLSYFISHHTYPRTFHSLKYFEFSILAIHLFYPRILKNVFEQRILIVVIYFIQAFLTPRASQSSLIFTKGPRAFEDHSLWCGPFGAPKSSKVMSHFFCHPYTPPILRATLQQHNT